MLALSFAALTLAAQASSTELAPIVDQVDAAYEVLSSGENQQALDRIDAAEALVQEDPARLINLGIALARQGRDADARTMFEAAASGDTRYQLETADGSWVDSRRLARRALAMLDNGEFASSSRVAQR